ncbi:hypothetical protein NDU88_005223 [Pleurodeles waltl]|uniref:Uncharacterized protein n=1 Tax=Pleurodeles waltl TaxID=8319 RepID=A0AAV7TC00_PLEWA|nr:hypothetical protein NDU88_005223 [Pleurodeles waltl]
MRPVPEWRTRLHRTQHGAAMNPGVARSRRMAGPVESAVGVEPKSFFGTLCEDIAEVNCNIAAEVRDLRRDTDELGQRVDTMEHSGDAQDEEFESHSKELLELRDTNMELCYQLEDYIHIKGVPLQGVTGSLKDYVQCRFRHVMPKLAG